VLAELTAAALTSAPAGLVALVVAVVGLMLAALLLKRPHPNHEFSLQLLATLGQDTHGDTPEEHGNGLPEGVGKLPDLDGAHRRGHRQPLD
jgi:hypothetical protein